MSLFFKKKVDFGQEYSDFLDFDDKMVSFVHQAIGNEGRGQRTLGLILMAAAGLFLTLGNVLVQFVYQENRKMSSFEILFARSLVQLVFTILFMISGKVHPYGDRKQNLITLIAMGVAEVAAIIFVYLALSKIPVADATVVQFTAPVFTILFSFLFLRKGCGIVEVICGVVSFVGVIFIAKPNLLIPQSLNLQTPLHHSNVHKNNITTIMFDETSYLIGSSYALLAAMCLSLFFILNKLNGLKLDVTLTVFYPSALGVIIAPAAMAIKKEKFLLGEISGEYWGIIVAVGFVSFIGMMFMGESLQLEDAGPAVLIRNLDVIYAYILQYLLMHYPPTISAIIGTIIVLGASSVLALNRVFNLQEKCCEKCCGKKCSSSGEIEKGEETHFMLNNTEEEEEINH